jgi:hypothetical protein
MPGIAAPRRASATPALPTATELKNGNRGGRVKGKIVKNRTVELRFRSFLTPTARIPMVMVTDTTTGEVLMVQVLRDTGEWLANMNYKWVEGSQALWEKTK